MNRVTLCLVLTTLGCEDPIHPVSYIEKTRPLGARVETAAEPERATPNPGEAARVDWLIAGPHGTPPTSFALFVCERDEALSGVPGCAAQPFDAASRNDLNVAPPALQLTAPANSVPLLVFGVVCAASPPRVPVDLRLGWPTEFGCDDGSSGSRVHVGVAMGPEEHNRNPEFGASAISLDEEPWPELAEPCSNSGLVRPAGGASSTIRVGLRDEDRENGDHGRETLVLSAFASAGELSRPLAVVEANDPTTEPELSFGWKHPQGAPASGPTIHFWFVLRDGRGGTAFAARSLCLSS